MQLHEFVETTLVEIVEGVVHANEHFEKSEIDGAANPPGAERVSRSGTDHLGVSNVHAIAFDVAVTVDETICGTSEKKAGIAIKVLSATIGKATSLESSHSSVSRLQFTIPLQLPRPVQKKDSK